MSSDDWRKRVLRLQGNDQLITFAVIICVVALIVHEGAKLIQGSPPLVGNNSDQVEKMILAVLAGLIYSKCRQTHKDVIHDVGATTELKETMHEVAPAIRDATEKLDSDAQSVVNSLVVQHNAAWEKMIQDRRVERHDLAGQLQAAQMLRLEAEHEVKALREKLGLLEGMLAAKTRTEERAADRAEDRAARGENHPKDHS